jgi:hypothetical protein
MTLDEIRTTEKVWLTPDDVSDVLESNPQAIRIQAQEDPSKLGFPVTVIGTRVKINRNLFLAYFDGRLPLWG